MKTGRIPLKIKLIATLILTTVFPFLLIVFMFLGRVESIFEQQMYQTRDDVIRQNAHAIDAYLTERKKDLIDVANSPGLRDLSCYDNQSQHLEKSLEGDNSFKDLAVYCLENSEWDSTSEGNFDDLTTSTWFTDVIDYKRLNIASTVYPLTSEELLVFAVPLVDENENLERVLVGFLEIDKVIQFLDDAHAPSGNNIIILNNKNVQVSKSSKDITAGEALHFKYIEYSGVNSGVLEFIDDGKEFLGFYYNLSIVEGADNTSWKVINIEQKSDFLSSILNFQRDVVFILFLIFLVSIGFSTLSIMSLSRSISKLMRGANEFSQGNLDFKIDLNSSDELGDLAHTFNNMALRLKKMYSNLEAKVTQKTETLSEKIAEMRKSNVLLEETKKAMLNVLEDLENEKAVLSREKAKDEAVLLAIGDGLVVTDQDRKILLVNKAFERLLGWSKDEVLTKSMSSVVRMESESGEPVSDKHRFRPLLLISGKKVRPMDGTFVTTTSDYYYVRKDKTRFPVVTTSTPIIIDEEVVGTVEVFRDVTEEKEIDRAKSEFVSLASHQLRTPLSTIKWYTEMLVNEDAGKLSEDQKKYMDEIYIGNERMIELVNALLNVSRIEMGTLAVDPQPTNLIDLVNGVIDELKTLIEEKSLVFSVNFEKDIPMINVDPKMIRIAIQNILTNAVKYTPPSGKIDFDIQKTGSSILLKITDSGIGIPQQQQSKIFTKLFRADNVKELDTQGTGLGLYIVKSIIDETGGKIWFKSEEGRGTSFYVTIPLRGMKKKKGSKTLT